MSLTLLVRTGNLGRVFFEDMTHKQAFMIHADALQTVGTLLVDLSAVMTSPDDETCRRNTVRCYFALLEGFLYNGKQMIPALAKFCDGKTISGPESQMVDEVSYALADNGTIQTEKAKLRLRQNFKFWAGLGAKYLRMKPVAYDKDPGWNSLVKSIAVRDRLMHPKASKDLAVTDAEWLEMQNAIVWTSKIGRSFVDAMQATLTRSTKRRRDRRNKARRKQYELAKKQARA